MKRLERLLAVLFVLGVCARAEDVKSHVKSLIDAVCIDSQCIRDSEVQYVRSRREEAIPIFEEA